MRFAGLEHVGIGHPDMVAWPGVGPAYGASRYGPLDIGGKTQGTVIGAGDARHVERDPPTEHRPDGVPDCIEQPAQNGPAQRLEIRCRLLAGLARSGFGVNVPSPPSKAC
jgi:hypothetical protein